jgi:hypothetical protein
MATEHSIETSHFLTTQNLETLRVAAFGVNRVGVDLPTSLDIQHVTQETFQIKIPRRFEI